MTGSATLRLRRALIATAWAALAALATAAPPAAASSPDVAVLVRFDGPPTARNMAAVERAGRVTHRYAIVDAVAAVLPERAVSSLAGAPGVAAIEPDLPVRALDYRATHDWGIGHVNADDVHAGISGLTGTGVTVAVIDSGVDCDHAELGGARCTYGENYIDPSALPDDDWGHGTHVAGTVAAQRDAGISTGVVGVAPTASLRAYKVLDDGGYGSVSDVIAAVDHVYNGGQPLAQVVNMSLGWGSGTTTFKQSMDRAYAAGILLVAAAGNGGNCGGKGNSVSYPAKYDSVVAVAAVDRDNTRPCWSSTGAEVEVAAPGVSVFSTWPADLTTSYRDPQPVCENAICHYKYGSGTSMSVPHVAGAAALVMASGTLTDDSKANGLADEARARLAATAVDVGAAGRDPQFGHGVIDALAAVTASSSDGGGGGTEPPPGGIVLEAHGHKEKGSQYAHLTWSGTEANVDVWRDAEVVAHAVEGTTYTDAIGAKGSGSYVYEVCETGTTVCSNEVTVTF